VPTGKGGNESATSSVESAIMAMADRMLKPGLETAANTDAVKSYRAAANAWDDLATS
jgi:hypothetical protein